MLHLKQYFAISIFNFIIIISNNTCILILFLYYNLAKKTKQKKNSCTNCYKCADVIIYMVTLTLCAVFKIHTLIILLSVTYSILSVEQCHLQQTKSP